MKPMNAQLEWKANKFPRLNSLGQRYEVYNKDNFDVIARAVCREEIGEAMQRIKHIGRKFFYCPSSQWTRTRLTFRIPKNNYNYDTNTNRGSRLNPPFKGAY